MKPLSAPYQIDYHYKRSLGPVLGRFMAELEQGQIIGSRCQDGRVLVPPSEFDPRDGSESSGLVRVAATGRLETWSWQPQGDFAFGLIRLDGTDSALLHRIQGAQASELHQGMGLIAVFADERRGQIDDIDHFRPAGTDEIRATDLGEPVPPLTEDRVLKIPLVLDYQIRAGATTSDFLRGMARGEILGNRCPQCHKVQVPARPACTTCSVLCESPQILDETGTITTFAIIRIEFPGQRLAPPYVCAWILLDGADTALLHLVSGDPENVRMGQRVRAVWKAEADWGPTLESIRYFEATGEPDRPFEEIAEHL